MASRKQKPPSAQLGLGILPSTISHASPRTAPNNSSDDAIVDGGILGPSEDHESFDDYDDASTVEGVPRLRLADPPHDAPTVIVESVGDVFEVSRLRDNGTTVACVMWTRDELEELQRRITAALET